MLLREAPWHLEVDDVRGGAIWLPAPRLCGLQCLTQQNIHSRTSQNGGICRYPVICADALVS
jgi:hypothetical protein